VLSPSCCGSTATDVVWRLSVALNAGGVMSSQTPTPASLALVGHGGGGGLRPNRPQRNRASQVRQASGTWALW
jgi:hypothetical protein